MIYTFAELKGNGYIVLVITAYGVSVSQAKRFFYIMGAKSIG